MTVTGAGSTWSNSSGSTSAILARARSRLRTAALSTRLCYNRDELLVQLEPSTSARALAIRRRTRHAQRAERRIWRRHRYDQLQSHVRRLRVCAGDQRHRHRQCARRHHHAHRCQHLQWSDERQRGHVASRRAEHVQPKFASDGRGRRNARSQWLQPDRTRRHQCRPGEHGHGHRRRAPS